MKKDTPTIKQVVDRLDPSGIKKYGGKGKDIKTGFKESLKDVRKTLEKLHTSVIQSEGGKNGR